MFGFLKRMLATPATAPAPTLPTIYAYWLTTTITLPQKVRTPGGSSVTVVNVSVDIQYEMIDGQFTPRRATLSGGGGRIMGSDFAINVSAARTGEAWYTSYICSEHDLLRAVFCDLEQPESGMRKIGRGRQRHEERRTSSQTLADALNRHVPPKEVGNLLDSFRGGTRVGFTYTSDRGISARRVHAHAVKDRFLMATDEVDNQVKSFLLERISNAVAIDDP